MWRLLRRRGHSAGQQRDRGFGTAGWRCSDSARNWAWTVGDGGVPHSAPGRDSCGAATRGESGAAASNPASAARHGANATGYCSDAARQPTRPAGRSTAAARAGPARKCAAIAAGSARAPGHRTNTSGHGTNTSGDCSASAACTPSSSRTETIRSIRNSRRRELAERADLRHSALSSPTR